MIRKLRRRMTLLVIGVLVLVSAGIVIAIGTANMANIAMQAETSLEALAEHGGARFTLEESNFGTDTGSEKTSDESRQAATRPDGEMPSPPPKPADRFRPDGRSREMSREEVASLSNFYSLTLDAEGQIIDWSSDRADLYDQESLQGFADQVLAEGKEQGQLGTQFYRMTDGEDGNRLLLVLDARLEVMAGQRVVRTTALVAGIACLLLSAGAWLLIRRMVAPVEEAFQKQQQFVWDASHELKTPLAVMGANAALLEDDIGENEYLGYIRSEIRRADGLVKNLLTLARMDKGPGDRPREEMDLSDAVTEVLLPFESTVFEAGKQLEDRIAPEVRCTGNKEMLQQLTVILLSNALKYSDEGGTIRVTLEKKGKNAELQVENTGRGIAKEDLERIFDRFYRTDASRNSETGGEGLGLAIARSIVEIHKGKIRAESEEGAWARFIVTIPA